MRTFVKGLLILVGWWVFVILMLISYPQEDVIIDNGHGITSVPYGMAWSVKNRSTPEQIEAAKHEPGFHWIPMPCPHLIWSYIRRIDGEWEIDESCD